MSKQRVIVLATGLAAVLGGCGGSGNSGRPSNEGGAPLSQFQATLPDGSAMEIEILADDNLAWDGEFAVAAESGPYAHQTGSFEGSISGNTVNATGVLPDGTTFQLTGTVDGKSLQLTRSDIPGQVLNFQPVTPMAPASRSDVSFNLSTSGASGSTGSSGRVTMSSSPYSAQGTLTEYRGTWLGLNLTFWSYSSGYASLVTYANDYAVSTANFSKYTLSDFSTARQTAISGRVSVYSPVTRTQVQFPNIASVSP